MQPQYIKKDFQIYLGYFYFFILEPKKLSHIRTTFRLFLVCLMSHLVQLSLQTSPRMKTTRAVGESDVAQTNVTQIPLSHTHQSTPRHALASCRGWACGCEVSPQSKYHWYSYIKVTRRRYAQLNAIFIKTIFIRTKLIIRVRLNLNFVFLHYKPRKYKFSQSNFLIYTDEVNCYISNIQATFQHVTNFLLIVYFSFTVIVVPQDLQKKRVRFAGSLFVIFDRPQRVTGKVPLLKKFEFFVLHIVAVGRAFTQNLFHNASALVQHHQDCRLIWLVC